MMRMLWMVLSCCCIAATISAAAGAGYLWSQGHLSSERVKEIRELFHPREAATVVAEEEEGHAQPSSDDVLRERSLRVLSLNSLETEANLLKAMLETERSKLVADQLQFEKQKAAFVAELKKLTEENAVAAREQARAILLALPPVAAVDRLMQLTLEEDVLLLKEMPEQQIALILKEFNTPPEGQPATPAAGKELQDRATRGRDVFQRLVQGEPKQAAIQDAARKINQPVASRDDAKAIE